MIIGQYSSKLTDKDRVSVPKKFRIEFGDSLVVARWYESCLILVSEEMWNSFLERLGVDTKLLILPVRDIDRFVLGSAYEVSLDKQGRFIVPEILKTYADIKSEVVFVGLKDKIEIWSRDKWDEKESSAEKKASDAIERIAKDR